MTEPTYTITHAQISQLREALTLHTEPQGIGMGLCKVALQVLRSLTLNTGEPVGFCSVQPLRGNEAQPRVGIVWVGNTPVPGPLYTHPAPSASPTPPQADARELMTDEIALSAAGEVMTQFSNDGAGLYGLNTNHLRDRVQRIVTRAIERHFGGGK